MTLAIVGLYLVFTLAVGLFAYRQSQNTPDDYFLADRGIGPVVLFFTIISTNFSAFYFLGFAGAGYRIGYSYYGIMAFGTAIVSLTFYFVGSKAWALGKRHGYITPPELVGKQLAHGPLRLVYLTVMVLFTIPYLAIQPIGAGYLLEALTGGAIPFFWGAIILTTCMVLYVFLGGMRGIVLTDVLQGVLMLGLMVMAVLVIGKALGGISEANREVFQLEPALFSREGVGEFFTPRRWFSFMLLFFFAVPMFPQVFMRFFIPKSPGALRTAAILYPLVTALLFIGPVLIGVLGHLRFPGLMGTESDQILPMMLNALVPPWLAALVMVGALAAFMSTMDSQLLALSSMITRDVYVEFVDAEASVDRQVRVGRILVVALSVVGLAIALRPPDTIFEIATEAFTGLAVLFPTTLAAMYWKQTSPTSCIVSIVVGEILLIGYHYQWIPAQWAFGFLPVVPILILCVLVILAGSLARGPRTRTHA